MKMSRIEYLNETHQYVLDGIVIPSVSELTGFALNEQKANIPEFVLRRAGEFGTNVHNLIEDYETYGMFEVVNRGDEHIVEGWIDLTGENAIKVELMENIVYTEDYAGRYDLLGYVNNKKSLIDIKTNRNYPKEHLEVQMGLYVHALKEDIDCYCAWYDKVNKKWELRKVEKISSEMCEKIVDAFKNNLPSPLIKNELININTYSLSDIQKIKLFYQLKDEIDEIDKRVKPLIIQEMIKNNIKTFEDEDFRFTYVEPTTRIDVDRESLKRDGVYEIYTKEVSVKESLKITPKWRKNNEK